MFDLTGKGALVTGASGGIGSDIARALHGQGATVALSGTRKEALDALAAETQKGYVEKAVLLTQDINALTTIRAGMRDRMKNSKAMNGAATARELEESCRDMWKTWCAL